MRGQLVRMLTRDRVKGGTLAVVANIGTTIAAYEAATRAQGQVPANAMPDGRAVLADDGAAITLTLYSDTGAVAGATLLPARAAAIAGELVAAARVMTKPEISSAFGVGHSAPEEEATTP